jgi:hypothetical protein
MAVSQPSRRVSFTQHDVKSLESLSHLIPRADQCGIYVLSFDDGEQYVGQSGDVVSRFNSHHRRWADISRLDWHPCDQALLNERERQVIAGKLAAGVSLRNIKYARGPLGVSPLDPIVTPDEQLAWINGDDPFNAPDAPRHVDHAQQLAKRPSFTKLQKEPFFAVTVLALNAFILRTIPKPAGTERKFWVLTAMPATNRAKGHHRLATLSINKVEVFWLFSTQVEGEEVFWGHLQLSKSLLIDRLGTADFTRAIGIDAADMVSFEDAGYETSGGDGLRIRFVGTSWLDLLENEAVVEAARSFNLMLLRKGTSPLGRHHNYDLATWVLDPDPFELLGLDAGPV